MEFSQQLYKFLYNIQLQYLYRTDKTEKEQTKENLYFGTIKERG